MEVILVVFHPLFLFQVNSSTERRILFSVWSPCRTDDPKLIPTDEQIKLVKKGKNVYTGFIFSLSLSRATKLERLFLVRIFS
jgi:Domain of unknown function (DUF3472)